MDIHTAQFLDLKIISVKQETPHAKTYQLEACHATPLQYKPGQFLTFIIHTGKQELRRSYSILSLPGEPLRITVKKVDNGAISRYILQYWKEGITVTSLYPAGRFTIDPQAQKKRDIFCFAAGSGIIPILPQIRNLLAKEHQSIIHLVYSNHNEQDTLFLSEIEELTTQYHQLTTTFYFSEPFSRHHEQGHLSNISAEALVKRKLRFKKEDAVFLLCGPFTYMRMLRITLGFMHFNQNQILRENYVPESMRSGMVHHPVYPPRSVSLKIHHDVLPVKVESGQDILTAALRQGINLPYSCRGGVCGNCAALCKQGKIYMSINEVLTENDLKQGWVLTCTGYPEEDHTVLEFL